MSGIRVGQLNEVPHFMWYKFVILQQIITSSCSKSTEMFLTIYVEKHKLEFVRLANLMFTDNFYDSKTNPGWICFVC